MDFSGHQPAKQPNVRIAILGDVHSNRLALEAVVSDAKEQGAEAFLQVGDVVGYGPHPRECIEILAGLEARICLGNHDAAAVHLLDMEAFNPFAKHALEWTVKELGREHREFLASLPLQVEITDVDTTLVHGSLWRPESFDYVRSLASAARSLEVQGTRYCFVGHSHQPCLFSMDDSAGCEYVAEFRRDGYYRTQGHERLLVNVGSVGQPRDEDPRAAYVMLDTEEHSVRLVRVDYDIPQVQREMRSRGLPAMLADRLSFGL